MGVHMAIAFRWNGGKGSDEEIVLIKELVSLGSKVSQWVNCERDEVYVFPRESPSMARSPRIFAPVTSYFGFVYMHLTHSLF